MIRVGFVMAYTDHGWIGGVNYLSNLLHAVHSVPDRRIEPVLVIPPATPDALLAGFPAVEVIRTPLVDVTSKGRFARKVAERILGRDLPLERFLKANGIAVLSHSGHLGARAAIPTIGWLADFQHRRMPEFFQHSEIAARDRGYRRVADFCSTVLLSSADAQRDLGDFAPGAVAKSRVLHFISGFGGAGNEANAAALRAKYGFDGPYFHLPNQFWAHKNHRIVIDALALLKSRGRPALVLATGHTADRRQPAYFDGLMQHVKASGVEDCFRVLGLVPYDDLSALMRHAVGVVNPSFFEGWSTTVEESRSLGKTILLSDIPVHREQSPERAVFFDPRNAEDLADAITKALADFSPADEERHQVLERKRLPERFAAFGQRYETIVFETCGQS